MSQHDYVLENQSGASFRADLNSALKSIVTNNSDYYAPSTTYPFMYWVDNMNLLQKQRNSTNTEWVVRGHSDKEGYVYSGGYNVARYGGVGGDNSGQLAGFRNILLNPRISNGINQRCVVDWAAVAVGDYGYDRWKKVDGSNIQQIVRAGNYVPYAVYTLSGDNVVTGQITAPASGDWGLPPILNTADNVQLEKGYLASARERRPTEYEEFLCKSYYEKSYARGTPPGTATQVGSFAMQLTTLGAGYVSGKIGMVPKCSIPAIATYDLAGTYGTVYRGGNGQTGMVNDQTESSFTLAFSPGTNTFEFYAHWTASSEL